MTAPPQSPIQTEPPASRRPSLERCAALIPRGIRIDMFDGKAALAIDPDTPQEFSIAFDPTDARAIGAKLLEWADAAERRKPPLAN